MRRGVKSLALAMMLFVAAGLPGIEATPSSTPIQIMAMTELKSGSNGHFLATAAINGNKVRVMVDTGASAVALSYEDAEQVGLKPRSLEYTVDIATANGLAKAAPVTLRKVEIDGVRVSDVQGIVLQKGALNGTLLGMSFLSKLRGFSVEDGVLKLKN